MIFPVKPASHPAAARRIRLQRPSQDAPAQKPAPASYDGSGLPGRSFSAQLLDLGLRYNMPELVRKSKRMFEEKTGGVMTDSALRLYADAQNSFLDHDHLPLLVKWDA
ncbi:MAG: hypothetical protein HY053_07360 [Proteobacteria bacterium]|nr:hypothetical protein [Pseudomonadota bacterium]